MSDLFFHFILLKDLPIHLRLTDCFFHVHVGERSFSREGGWRGEYNIFSGEPQIKKEKGVRCMPLISSSLIITSHLIMTPSSQTTPGALNFGKLLLKRRHCHRRYDFRMMTTMDPRTGVQRGLSGRACSPIHAKRRSTLLLSSGVARRPV